MVSGCFTYAGIKFHISNDGLIYQDTDLPGFKCDICQLSEEKLKQHWKAIEMAFLYEKVGDIELHT